MEYAIGFIISLFVSLTGFGAGTVTVPILILFLNIPADRAVRIGLALSATVKGVLVPAQIVRGNVSWRTLGFMLLGGVPGIVVGSLLRHIMAAGYENLLTALLGAILVSSSSAQILYLFSSVKTSGNNRKNRMLLTCLMFPAGLEVGLSSVGAGALCSVLLLSITSLEARQVVGTDILFGFAASLIGSGDIWSKFADSTDMRLLTQLVAGAIFGAIIGTLLSNRVPRKPLKFTLCACSLILGAAFLLQSYQVWERNH